MTPLDRAYLAALKAATRRAAKPLRMVNNVYTGYRVPNERRESVRNEAINRAAHAVPDEIAKFTKLLEAHSMERYKGGYNIERAYGSSTVTKFLVRKKGETSFGDPRAVMVEGYGPTPGERKTMAMRKAAAILWRRGVL